MSAAIARVLLSADVASSGGVELFLQGEQLRARLVPRPAEETDLSNRDELLNKTVLSS